jgi:hypothetical protein
MTVNLEAIPGGKKYPLDILDKDEELVREAAKQLRQKFMLYRKTFPDKDELKDIDILSMVAIDIAVSHLRLEEKDDSACYEEKIQLLDNKLKEYLLTR